MKYFLTLFLVSFLTAGCSTSYVMVPPTAEELHAVRSIQKIIVIMPFSEDGTQISGFSQTVEHKLAVALGGQFRIIDPAQVQAALAADKTALSDHHRLAEIGKNLGADYVILGNVMAALKGPEIRYSTAESKENGFSAKIWMETIARADISLNMLSTVDASVVFFDEFWGTQTDTSNVVEFSTLGEYNKAVEAAKLVLDFKQAYDQLSQLPEKHYGLLDAAIDRALDIAQKNLRAFRAYAGEVLAVVSEEEITVNLGSAYGLEPRDMLSVWREGPPVKDPRTGKTIKSKERLGFVKIQRITSGLSCVAKGKKKQVRKMQAGDTVLIK